LATQTNFPRSDLIFVAGSHLSTSFARQAVAKTMSTTLLDLDEVADRPWADLPNPALKVHTAAAAAAAWPIRLLLALSQAGDGLHILGTFNFRTLNPLFKQQSC
jgi:hypothetical protein